MGWWPWTGLKRVPAAVMLAALFCCARAGGQTQWQNRPYSFTVSGPIQHVGETCTGTSALTLSHDGACTLSVSVTQAGDEVLTQRPGGPTLTTSYKLTGITDGDADYLSSGAFLLRMYSVPGPAGVENLTLWVRAETPPDQVPEAGDYTATIILTVTFN
jgi:hypothetical protein